MPKLIPNTRRRKDGTKQNPTAYVISIGAAVVRQAGLLDGATVVEVDVTVQDGKIIIERKKDDDVSIPQ